jgi:hypothetical protein
VGSGSTRVPRTAPRSSADSRRSASTAKAGPRPRCLNLNLARSGLFLSGWYAARGSWPWPWSASASASMPPPFRPSPATGGLAHAGAHPDQHLLDLPRTMLDRGAGGQGLSAAGSPGRRGGRDWDYITDYQHHKLLLVDGMRLQLGGRNVEDSYLCSPTRWSGTSSWTRTCGSTAGGGRAARFDRLWGFRTMVATLDGRACTPEQ